MFCYVTMITTAGGNTDTEHIPKVVARDNETPIMTMSIYIYIYETLTHQLFTHPHGCDERQ